MGAGPREFHAGQVNATVIIMLKTPDTVFFFDKVKELLALDPKIITDAYNPIHPHREFKAHRSDQSIMSLLAKMLPTSHFIPDETCYLDFEAIHHIPFLATRLRV